MTWEQRAFLEAAAGEPRYATMSAVLAKAGLRPGEGFALQPGDIDWGERTLRIERAWNLGRVKATKTYEERTVDLTPDLVRALAEHMTWLKAEALRRGWGEPEWLFPIDEGHPHDEARVRKVFKRALAKAKLPTFRARGGCADHLRQCAARSRESVATVRYYARWIPNKGRRWVDLLDRATNAVAAIAEAISSPIWNQIWNQTDPKSQIRHSGELEVPDSIGGPSRTRTLDPLIN